MPKEVPKLLNDDEAASLLGVMPATLSVWRCTRRYALPYVKVGRLIRYREQDLLAFLESRLVNPVAVEAR
jgi:excisionase family DNA binding protein